MPPPLSSLCSSVTLGRGGPSLHLSNVNVLSAYCVPGSALCPVCFHHIRSGEEAAGGLRKGKVSFPLTSARQVVLIKMQISNNNNGNGMLRSH